MSARGINGLPLVAFRLKDKKHYDEFDVARELRQRSWVVPAYTMAPNAGEVKMLRIVLREDFTRSRCDLFLRDLQSSVDHLESIDAKSVEAGREGHKKSSQNYRSGKRNAAKHEQKGQGHSLQGKHGKSHGIC